MLEYHFFKVAGVFSIYIKSLLQKIKKFEIKYMEKVKRLGMVEIENKELVYVGSWAKTETSGGVGKKNHFETNGHPNTYALIKSV